MNDFLIRNGIAGIAAVMMSFVAMAAHATTVYLLDFDGTIVDDQGPHSTWARQWHLKRVEELRNMHQADPQKADLPMTMAISYREFRRLAPLLARGEAQLNWLKPVDLDPDPLRPDRPSQIIPGYYYVSKEITFPEYRPAVDGESHLVRNQEEAIRRAALAGDAHWRGPAWALVERAMSNPATVENLKIFTAGNHHAWEWEKVFKIWKREKLIKHAHGKRDGERTLPRVYAMSDPSALVFGRSSFTKRKGALLRALAEELADSSRDRHFELSPDSRHLDRGIEREGHTLIVAEDDPQMLAEIRQKLMGLSAEFQIGGQVKFVLLNAMPAAERARDRLWPHEWTVFHRRVARAATPEEIALWTGADDCDSVLSN